MLHPEAQRHMLKYWTDEMYVDECQMNERECNEMKMTINTL
jgi:hypothetical protein